MVVVENGSSCARHFEAKTGPDSHADCDLENSNPSHLDKTGSDAEWNTGTDSLNLSNQCFNSESQPLLHNKAGLNERLNETAATRRDDFALVDINGNGNGINGTGSGVQNPYGYFTQSDDRNGTINSYNEGLAEGMRRGDYKKNGEEEDEGLKKNIRELEEMLSKLNPMAAEFVPSSMVNFPSDRRNSNFGYVDNLVMPLDARDGNGYAGRRKKNNYGQGKRRLNARTSMAQREEVIRRTVYVSDIDQQVTEEQLAALFINCGQVVDCRVCGDPNSVLRFAFVEFTDEEGARNALSLSGTMLGYYPVRVLPSKTAIAPVNPTFLPRSEDEREMCARTVYVTNIDKKVTQADIKLFFESLCGEVNRLRLLGDYHHSTRISFVEFIMAESAIAALNCSGVVLGSLPIRVSPSKTPVRPRPPHLLH